MPVGMIDHIFGPRKDIASVPYRTVLDKYPMIPSIRLD